MGKIVPERLVLGRAVVPKGNRADLPLEAALELGSRRMLKKALQQVLALLRLQSNDPAGENTVHKKRRTTADRMRSHHRMFRLRIRLPGILGPIIAAPVMLLAIVQRGQATQVLLLLSGKRRKGGHHVGKQRVPPGRRHL